MGKLEVRVKKGFAALAAECDGDMLLFHTVLRSKPQPRQNLTWNDVLDYFFIGYSDNAGNVTPLMRGMVRRIETRAIARRARAIDEDEIEELDTELETIAGWLEDAVETRVDVARDKLEKQHEKLGAAKPTDPLGRYAFATDRDKKNLPPEPNTSAENQLLNVLSKYVNKNVPMPEKQGKQLQTLLKKDLYTDVIHEPTRSKFYRGLALSRDTLAKLIGSGKKPIPKKGVAKRSVKLKPRKGIASSWTDSREVARGFAMDNSRSKTPCGVILVATRDDNPDRFVSGPDGLYTLYDLSMMRGERETIALGPIKISRIEWEIDEDDD